MLIALLVVTLVAGCGQKGPLRLPDAPPTSAAATDVQSNDPGSLTSRRTNPHE
ncbi:MAG: lipoprotein [Pseudomonadota bacterium]|nr:lipoprotein [Pseudomonadota bacterium]